MSQTFQFEGAEDEDSSIDLSVTDLGKEYRAAGDGGISSGCSCSQNILEDNENLDDLVN
jgi:hypothetical protein